MASHNRRIAVYGPKSEQPIFHRKYKVAAELVSLGRAEFIDDRSIRLKSPIQVAVSSDLIHGRQGLIHK